jgi:hypothetical protein
VYDLMRVEVDKSKRNVIQLMPTMHQREPDREKYQECIQSVADYRSDVPGGSRERCRSANRAS